LIRYGLAGIVYLTKAGRNATDSHPLYTQHVLPNQERLRAQEAIIDRLHEVTAKAKEILGQAMEREKSLTLWRRRKTAHMVFLLSRRLMRGHCQVK